MVPSADQLPTPGDNSRLFRPSQAYVYDLRMEPTEDASRSRNGADAKPCKLESTTDCRTPRTAAATRGAAARIYRKAAAAAAAAESSPRCRPRSQSSTPDGTRTMANNNSMNTTTIDPSWLPMDRFSQRLYCSGSGTCSPTGTPINNSITSPTKQKCYNDGGVFGRGEGSVSRRYYVIHPDWVSENLSVQKLNLSERKESEENHYSRSQSAPPTAEDERDIITWQSHK